MQAIYKKFRFWDFGSKHGLRLFPAALPLRMRKPALIHIRAHHHVAGMRSPFKQKAHAGAETISWRETVCLPAVASLGRRGPGPGHWRRAAGMLR